ncbi:MAG: hypothetical protein GY870_02530 [archaeon]|nr:hypothetical protein [archaeon]
MKKIIIGKFDSQLGPQPIIQYPPDPNFPDKEIFLRIWAHHEMNSSSAAVELIEADLKYLSIIKKVNIEVFFLVLQLEKSDKFTQYQEILLKISDSLFSAINSPHLTHVISETYTTIYEFSKLNEDQLFFNLFSEKDKLFILDILRKGSINKGELSRILMEKYGTSASNLDMLLNPFFHLELIKEMNVPGIKNALFLINDVYCCRLPPEKLLEYIKKGENPADKMYLSEISSFYQDYKLETKNSINILSKILSNPIIYRAFQGLYENKINKDWFLDLISQNMQVFQELKQEKLIVEIENFIYAMAEVHFFKFNPIYLLRELKKRFENKEISTDQFLTHISLLKGRN